MKQSVNNAVSGEKSCTLNWTGVVNSEFRHEDLDKEVSKQPQLEEHSLRMLKELGIKFSINR
jgi:hypothetical protein